MSITGCRGPDTFGSNEACKEMLKEDLEKERAFREKSKNAYKRLAEELGVSYDNGKLDCYDVGMKGFTPTGSSLGKLRNYYDYKNNCATTSSHTPFSLFLKWNKKLCEQASERYKQTERDKNAKKQITEIIEDKKVNEKDDPKCPLHRCYSNWGYCGNSVAHCCCPECKTINENVPIEHHGKKWP